VAAKDEIDDELSCGMLNRLHRFNHGLPIIGNAPML
jgi:hypothetical protein